MTREDWKYERKSERARVVTASDIKKALQEAFVAGYEAHYAAERIAGTDIPRNSKDAFERWFAELKT